MDSRLQRLIRRGRWSLLRRAGSETITTRTPWDAKLTLRFSDVFAPHAYFGAYEQEESTHIRNWVRAGMTTLDVGANVGYFTTLLSHLVGSSGTVLAFEPNPYMYARLLETLHQNDRAGNGPVIAEPVALGAEEGEVDFYCPILGHEGVGGLRDTGRAEVRQIVKVRARRLDDVVAERELERLDFIKMDIEGGELDLLRGAPRVLSDLRPVILFEAYDPNTAPYGYRVFNLLSYLEERGYITRQAGQGFNFIAVPRERDANPA